MVETSARPTALPQVHRLLLRFSQAIVLAYLVSGLLALASVPFFGSAWQFFRTQPRQDETVYFYVTYFIGVIFLASGFWIYAIRRHLAGGLAYGVFSTSAGLVIGLLYSILSATISSEEYLPIWFLALAMFGGSLLELAVLFPSEDAWVTRHPWLRLVGFIASLILGALSLLLGRPILMEGSFILIFNLILSGIALLFAIIWIGLRRLRAARSNEREQIRLVLLGMLLGFSPLLMWLLASMFFPLQVRSIALVLVPTAIFPLLCGYAVQRYRLVQTDYVLSRAALYGLLTVLVSTGYALLAGGLGLIFSGSAQLENPLFTGLAFFILALAILPLRQKLQDGIDAVFFHGQRAYQERVQTFSGELTSLVDLKSILQTLRSSLQNSLNPVTLHLFIYDPLSDQYIAAPDEQNRSTSDLRFATSSALVNLLTQQRFPLFLERGGMLPAQLHTEQVRLELLGAQLFAPLSGRQRLAGWLALGPRLSGEPYSGRELSFLDALCDQAALAIERAQVVVNLETRVRETNTLAQVAQGVNITLTLDDSLELIYAQTIQVIPADDFHVMLVNLENGQLREVFYVVDDERFPEYENRPPIGGSPLEDEIVRLRRPILTEDYNRECQKRGILSNRTKIFGWMSVPLNAGAETIGAVSLGKNDPSSPYTAEQLQLLQAIADQVASAIIKMRLLQETERRARQLSILNEVTRQLTSTLELEPLLNSILKSAVDILNCEAGSLLLVDESIGDLVFRATVGPVAGNLMNTRLPAGTGLAGKAVAERTPLIANDVQNTSGWFQQTDQQTGFVTHSILVIPLVVNDRATGVVEVINKKDGWVFTKEDLELLSTFAAQASVAVENARQFTVTDQALAARVEELSVMQRIDRELNTSLDVTTTMKITLEWALRQSGAAAGVIGTIQEDGLKIMAAQGYTLELEAFQNSLLPLNGTPLATVVENGSPQQIVLNALTGTPGLLTHAVSQLALPIRRETTTIGLMLIESTASQPISAENMGFLQRLGDHASVAISNAQFYAAVQAANLAKSEFVSFVAHELKNPMTSIKGYTELLAAKAVGPVNEAQANFLQTIRSNIDRMNTLVSDLNDMSKIEAGRLRLDFKALPLSAAVDDIVRSTRRQVEEKGQQLLIQLPADLPMVWADRTRLAQVLVNLVSNAYKYTPQSGQIVVSAAACDNQWDPTGARRVVHIWVQDNGIGINPEDQKKIFQKFFRSEDPKTREVPGTGLGLNITRSLVEMQGGRIWFESEFRKGTTFHFTVPIAE